MNPATVLRRTSIRSLKANRIIIYIFSVHELIPKSNASPSLLAYIALAKYADSLPLYRQEEIFKRIGLDLPRQTMARWMIKAGEAVGPLATLLREELLIGSYLFMDETTVQVLKEDGKKAQTKSFMWVQGRATSDYSVPLRAGPWGHPC